MLTMNEIPTVALQAHKDFPLGVIDRAVLAFMANLGESRCPSREELQSAMIAARGKLRDGLFNPGTIQKLIGGDAPDNNRLAEIELSFNLRVPPLLSPPLPAYSELPPMQLALAALLGAVLGMLIGSPVGIYLLAMRDVGLLIGAPLGAFATTWATDQASRNKWLSRMLITALGVATVAELWAFLSVSPWNVIRQRLSGRNSNTFARIAMYLLLIVLLVCARRRATYDRAILEQSVRQTIDDWLHGALVVLAVQAECSADRAPGGRSEVKAMSELGKRIMGLHAASANDLPGLADDVIDAARDAGFEGLQGPANFRQTSDRRESQVLEWAESMRERYNVFGHVEPGDAVRIEQEPVVFSGEVREKGLVRKQRGG